MLTGKRGFKIFSLKRITLLAVLGLYTLIISAIVFSPYLPENINLVAGDIAPENIVSPKYLEFESAEDKIANHQLIEETKKNIGKVYVIDSSINAQIIENLRYFFQATNMKSYQSLSLSLKQILTEKEFLLLTNLKKDPTKKYETDVLNFTKHYLLSELREQNQETLFTEIQANFNYYNPVMHVLTKKILSHYIEPNFIIDEEQSNLLREQAIKSLNLRKTIYRQGQVIVYKSTTVEPMHIEVFKALNIYNRKANIMTYLGIFIITICSIFLLVRFIKTFNHSIDKLKYYVLIGLIMTLVIGLSRFVFSLSLLPDKSVHFLLIPISLSSMLLSFLVASNISLLTGSLISILVALLFQNSFEALLFLFFSNSITTFYIHQIHKRSELIYTGYKVGIFNTVFVIALGLLNGENNILWYGIHILAAFGNGVLSSMISLAILPYFESLFKITTSQTLLELSNLNHPLLKKMMTTAPGTYQHSLMVASLSEAAAEAVNADALQCRVGSYFHDIGKLKRPQFFSENQFSSQNPHDDIAPKMSKMIILSHVKEGYDMAKQHKLPAIIQDIILQHHGSSLLSLFFEKEKLEHGENCDSDAEFRYPGPLPKSKEAGIVMLADSIEATIRSLNKPSPEKIDATIQKIFKDKLDDKQLDECPLTFDDINKIRQVFLNFFKGVHHNRLDYQKEFDKLTTSDDSKKNQKFHDSK